MSLTKAEFFRAWVRRRRCLVPDEEEEALKKRLNKCTRPRRDERSPEAEKHYMWLQLPYNVRALVFDYLQVLPPSVEEDFEMMMALVFLEDTTVLRASSNNRTLTNLAPPSSGARPTFSSLTSSKDSLQPPPFRPAEQYNEMFSYLEREVTIEYPARLSIFAVTAVRLGLAAKQDSAQRRQFSDALKTALSELRFQQSRVADLARWVEFREEMMSTPCSQLYCTIREDLALWRELMRQWKAARDDLGVKLAMDELRLYEKRVQGIEYLGQPTLEVDDIKNMLWDVNLRAPAEGLADDYPKSITVGQALTLGIVDLPWVRGYAWEDREVPMEPLEQLGSGPGEEGSAVCGASIHGGGGGSTAGGGTELDLRLNSAAGGSRSRCSTSRQERIQQLLGLTDASTKKQEEELEAERIRLESLAAEQRQRAHHVAADGMTQRLWISTQTFLPRWKHRFCGCEICSKLPLHYVGLRRENCGAAVDIVLCNDCYADHYADEDSVAHRMYSWFLVRDLITS